MNIPKEFWAQMSFAEFNALIANDGWMDAGQCARLWRLTDRQDEPPARMQIVLNMDDVKKVFP